MSTINCKIQVINKSNVKKAFYIFQDIPAPSQGPSGKVFTNVYQCSPRIDGDPKGFSSSIFKIPTDYYAIFGTSENGTNGVKITTSSAKKVEKLGPSGTIVAMSVASDGSPTWDTASVQGKSESAPGGFGFYTDSSFKIPNNYDIWLGVGGPDPKDPGNIVPIQTYQAEPTLNSILFPKITYYVCTGQFTPGTVVDRNAIGEYCKLEFEGAAIPEARIVFTQNETYQDDDDKTARNGVSVSVGRVG